MRCVFQRPLMAAMVTVGLQWPVGMDMMFPSRQDHHEFLSISGDRYMNMRFTPQSTHRSIVRDRQAGKCSLMHYAVLALCSFLGFIVVAHAQVNGVGQTPYAG
jgi:hypothetical protein